MDGEHKETRRFGALGVGAVEKTINMALKNDNFKWP